MRVAAIDIGTNSVLLLIAERQANRVVRVLDVATITRLGEGVDQARTLKPEAITRTLACLSEYAATIRAEGAERVAVVGTSAMRDAAGGSEFVARAREIVGVEPEVISGAREAQLTFEGALTSLDTTGQVGVFDIGGGSTEIIVGARVGESGTLSRSVSLDVGSVRMTERHLLDDPPTPKQVEALRASVAVELERAPSLRGLPLVGVAGTITTLAAVAHAIDPYDGSAVHGSMLTRDDLGEALERFLASGVEGRRSIIGLHPQRADVIIAGALIADCICEAAEANHMIVSDRGVRWGVATQLARAT